MDSQLLKLSRNNLIFNRVLQFAAISLGFSLPFRDQFSTVAIGLLLACGLYLLFIDKKKTKGVVLKALFLIPILLILPRIFGLFYGEFDNATKELVRSIPLLAVPLAFILLSAHASAKRIRSWFFYGLLAGILLFTVICYYPVISTMIQEEQPLSFLLRWRYMNFNFTRPFDAHPAYIGLLIIWLITHVLFSKTIYAKYRIWISLGLVVILFQLVARNALFFAGLLVAVYIVKSKIKWLQVVSVVLLLTTITAVIWHPSDYLRDKFFYIFIDDAKEKENTRFERLDASFEVFSQAPVFGVGPGTDNALRMEAYLAMGETVAYENNYNAHNQFVEFLSTFGIFGLSCFLFALFLAFKAVIQNKNWIDLLLLFGVIMAMLTESLLERSLGVKYLSVLIAFILLNHLTQTREDNLSDGRRP